MAGSIEADAIAPGPGRRPTGFQRAVGWMSAIGTVWIFALMFLIVADVLGRNFFDHPITGVAEIAGRSIVAIVFLQIASAVASGRMTRADIIIRKVEERAPLFAWVLEIAFAGAGAAVFLLIAYASWPDFLSAWQTNDFFGVQGLFTIPTWPFRAIVVAGSVVAAVAYVTTMFGGARAAAATPE